MRLPLLLSWRLKPEVENSAMGSSYWSEQDFKRRKKIKSIKKHFFILPL